VVFKLAFINANSDLNKQCNLPRPYQNSFPGKPFGCIFRPNITIITITHGGKSDAFWWVVKDAVLRAGNDLRVTSEYRTTTAVDYQGMAFLLYEAIQEKPDGLIVSMPSPQILGPPVQAAVAAGIPVITINSGAEVFQSLGALHHVGQDEKVAGYEGCKRLIKLDPFLKVILVPDNEGGQNVGVNDRAAGCKEAGMEMGLDSNNVIQLPVSKILGTQTKILEDFVSKTLGITKHTARQVAFLASNVLTVQVVQTLAQNLNFSIGDLKVGCFDFSEAAAESMQQGYLSFAIDQQQYLQGYLPVVMLANYVSTKNIFAPQYQNNSTLQQIPLLTGPQFITVEKVRQKGCEAIGVIYCDDPASPAQLDPHFPLLYTLIDTKPSCPCIDGSNISIGFVHNGGESDLFWMAVQNGASLAARDMGVKLILKNTTQFDPYGTSGTLALARELVDSPLDGLVMTIPSDPFKQVLEIANEKNLPVIAINTGFSIFEQYGVLLFVGQENIYAGYESSAKLHSTIEEILSNTPVQLFLCLDGSSGTVSSYTERCNGTLQWLNQKHQQIPPSVTGYGTVGTVYSPQVTTVYLIGSDVGFSEITLAKYLAALKLTCPTCNVTGMIAMEDTDCEVAQNQLNLQKTPENPIPFCISCFDTGWNAIQGIKSENVQFAVSQQQWLQGYFPVVFLTLKKLNGNSPVFLNRFLATGPAFTESNLVPYKVCENQCDPESGNYIGWEVCPMLKSRQFPTSSTSIERISESIGISVYVLASFLLLILTVTSCTFFYHQNTKLMKASTMSFCQMMLLFMGLMVICAVLFVKNPSDLPHNCAVRPWILAISLLGVLSPLFAKTSRLAQIFNDGQMKRIKITNRMLLLEIGKAMVGGVVILSIWFSKEIPYSQLVEINYQQELIDGVQHTAVVYQEQCKQQMLFVWILTAYILSYVVYGSSLAYQTRNLPEAFNESKSIGMSLYCFAIMGALSIGLLVLVQSNRNAVAVLISYGLMIIVLTIWSTIFGTKLNVLYQGRGDLVSFSSTPYIEVNPVRIHQLQDENKRLKAELEEANRVIEKLNSKGVHSSKPMRLTRVSIES